MAPKAGGIVAQTLVCDYCRPDHRLKSVPLAFFRESESQHDLW
jgi:hypothetical protein